jgi:hypothetical protein
MDTTWRKTGFLHILSFLLLHNRPLNLHFGKLMRPLLGFFCSILLPTHMHALLLPNTPLNECLELPLSSQETYCSSLRLKQNVRSLPMVWVCACVRLRASVCVYTVCVYLYTHTHSHAPTHTLCVEILSLYMYTSCSRWLCGFSGDSSSAIPRGRESEQVFQFFHFHFGRSLLLDLGIAVASCRGTLGALFLWRGLRRRPLAFLCFLPLLDFMAAEVRRQL